VRPNPHHTSRLRAIPLPAVLLAAGARADRHDKARWHTAQGVISATKTKFFNWNRGCGGGGAIDLVIHLYGLNFKAALAWLASRFPHYTPPPAPLAEPTMQLKLPAPHPAALSALKQYLAVRRAIPPAVVDRLVQTGDLYADAHANAVFLLRGQHNIPVGAELRGTGPQPWRGMAPGSRKNLGFFSIRSPQPRAILLCESAIDAISCFLIHPALRCISTAGATPDPAWLPPLIRLGSPIYCGFDDDATGNAMAQTMIQRHPDIKRLRPPHHDWNDSLKSNP